MYIEFIIIYVALAVLALFAITSLILLFIVLKKLNALSSDRRPSGASQMDMKGAYNTAFTRQRNSPVEEPADSASSSASTFGRPAGSLAFCRKCASELSPEDRFCPKCGLPR